MAQTVKTQALAAYVESLNRTFAGEHVTLPYLVQIFTLAPTVLHDAYVDTAILDRIARYLRLSTAALIQAIAAQADPEIDITFDDVEAVSPPAPAKARAATEPSAPPPAPAKPTAKSKRKSKSK